MSRLEVLDSIVAWLLERLHNLLGVLEMEPSPPSNSIPSRRSARAWDEIGGHANRCAAGGSAEATPLKAKRLREGEQVPRDPDHVDGHLGDRNTRSTKPKVTGSNPVGRAPDEAEIPLEMAVFGST
jgi:hypothetical protein